MADTKYAPAPVAAEEVLRVLAEAFFAARKSLTQREQELTEGYGEYASEGFSLRENRLIMASGKAADDPDLIPTLGMTPLHKHRLTELAAEFALVGEPPHAAFVRISENADCILAEIHVDGKIVMQRELSETLRKARK